MPAHCPLPDDPSVSPRARLLVAGLLLLVATAAARADQLTPEQSEFFERHIRPVLVERCYECHSAKSNPPKGGLRLDSPQAMRTGGDSGPALLPGNPQGSLLAQAIRYESFEMPPDGKLSDDAIANIEKWISLGAPDPRQESPDTAGNRKVPVAAQTHWAFQPPKSCDPPPVNNDNWPHTPVDRFVLAELELAALSPSPAAEPRALLRRLHFALTGLPPSHAEREAFAAEATDEAYADAVDRLLASPRFGERWGRHWLDIARYADTKGYVFQEDRNYPAAPSYRDWVIDAFNKDLPYDRFIVAQLAADQIDDPSAKPAMGFLTLGRIFLNNAPDIIDDRIDVTTRGLLGLTVTCARCHDHKYDPIPTADYYSLYGVFASSKKSDSPEEPLMLVDEAQPTEPVVFLRGNPSNRGPQVPRRFLSCLIEQPQPFQHGSGRKELALAIASPNNPLTARVWVNRVWGHLFGQPLVNTPSDFGARSDPPSHPELLDWLATHFVAEGWSTKQLIRELVLSSTFRQSSADRPECRKVDPENRLLWRMNRQRLEMEPLRDSLLVAAGRLDTTMGGPSVQLTQAPYSTRRAVYGFIERQNLPGFFRTFDFAGPDTHAPQRPQTTVPQQALFLMNSPFVLQQAELLARRNEVLSAPSPAEQVTQLYRAAHGRDPAPQELNDAIAFLTSVERTSKTANEKSWRYGWGTVDDSTRQVTFHELPHFEKDAWQGGSALPDPALGWTRLTADGGHPGDAAHCVIRRWIAPRAGVVSVSGVLQHPSDKGDGVRGRILSSSGVSSEWTVQHSEQSTTLTGIPVEPGTTIDFVTDFRTAIEHDDYHWKVTIELQSESAEPQKWDSEANFSGPAPLSPLEQLAHVLLMSNEFAFVD